MTSPTPLVAFHVSIDQVVPDPDQPRTAVDQSGISTLVESIRARGVLQPLLVSDHPDPEARKTTPYMIVAGERRWQAARRAGLATVPVVVHPGPLSPDERLILQLDENDGELRRELSLYDRAAAVERAFKLSRLRKDEFAQRHKKSKAWVSHYLGIAHATGPTQEALASGLLTGITVTGLFSRLSPSDQRRLLTQAKRTRLPITAAQIEARAQRSDEHALPPAERRRPAAGAASTPAAAETLAPGDPSATPAPAAAAGAPAAATRPGAGPATPARSSRPRTDTARWDAADFLLAPGDIAALLLLLGREPRGNPREQFGQLLALARPESAAAAADDAHSSAVFTRVKGSQAG